MMLVPLMGLICLNLEREVNLYVNFMNFLSLIHRSKYGSISLDPSFCSTMHLAPHDEGGRRPHELEACGPHHNNIFNQTA